MLFVFAGFATVLYNTGSLHGTFMLVYGASEGEGDDVGADAEITSAPRRALGTGVVLTLMIVTAGTAVCFALAPSPLPGAAAPPSGGPTRALGGVSAAAGSLWRLTVNVFRMERRPGRFALFNATRPLFVIAGVVPLVALGFGVEGALAGTALGTLAATAVSIAMARRSYAFAFCFVGRQEDRSPRRDGGYPGALPVRGAQRGHRAAARGSPRPTSSASTASPAASP